MSQPAMPRQMRVYKVTVQGYGSETFLATSNGGAKYVAYCCDAFSHLTFKDFLKRCSARLEAASEDDGYGDLRRYYPTATIPAPGTRIHAEGLTGVVLPAVRRTNYVSFQPDGEERIANVHPLSVRIADAAPKEAAKTAAKRKAA